MAAGHDPPPSSAARHAVVAIIRDRDRLLFVQRSHAARAAPGYWTPVSGAVEPGESEREAVAREVCEEVGLTVVADTKVASVPTHDGRYVLHFWTCRVVAGHARVASDEVADVCWYTPEELRVLAPVFDEDVRIVLGAYGGLASWEAHGGQARDGSH